MKRPLILLSLLLSAFASLAQARVAEIKLIYFQKPDGAPQSMHIYSNGVYMEELQVPSRQFSMTVPVKGRGELTLTFADQKFEGKADEVEEMLRAYPTVQIPEGWNKVLLLAFEDQGNKKLPVKLLKVNASGNEFRPGDIHFINLSKYGVVGPVGKKELKLRPRKSMLIRGAATVGEEFDVRVDIIKPESKMKRQSFFYQRWKTTPDRKQMVFIYEPDGGRPSYTSVSIKGF